MITNYSNTHSSIQLPSIQLPSIQASFAELLSELERVNDDLLQAMKTNNREAFTNLIDRRSQISEQIQAVTNSSSLNNQKLVEMPDNLKIKLERILIQDRELMIYLELEVQKLKGKYQKLNMDYQRQITQNLNAKR
ncbi:MAG: hypothetical protein ACK481_04635 [Candidatus Melainabacteria bacterium]